MVLVIHLLCPIICQSTLSFILASESALFKPFILIRYCLVGIAIMVLGVIYWAVWRVILPKIFGYKLVPNKVVLDDGTVVVVVRFLFYHSFGYIADHSVF